MKVYEAMTLSRKVGCGSIYCIFNEKEYEFHNIIIKGDMPRDTPCGESWMAALASILTFALRRSIWEGTAQKALVKHLLNHRCNNPLKDWNTKEVVTSCSHAVGVMILEYLKSRNYDAIEKEKEEATKTED